MNNNVFFLSFFFFFFKYLPLCLHISFLKYLFLTVLGLRCWAQAFSSCCQQGLLSSCGAGLLNVAASLLVMHGLGYSQARGIFPALRSSPVSLPLQGRFPNHWTTTEAPFQGFLI